MEKITAAVQYTSEDFQISEFDNKFWKNAQSIQIVHYWSGEKAPVGRRFETKLLWTDAAFYVRFEANQNEPFIISANPNLMSKTVGLWNRDVCEIFLAPNKAEFQTYFEFEIAPTGEWVDLKIHQKTDERITVRDYNSGMKTAVRIVKGKVLMAFKVEWKAFDVKPKAGDVWLGNIFRAVGSAEKRGYLAWSPTKTNVPNFHVPEKFGRFEFVK